MNRLAGVVANICGVSAGLPMMFSDTLTRASPMPARVTALSVVPPTFPLR